MLDTKKLMSSGKDVSYLINCLFTLQVQAHVSHLSSKSYSEHKALQNLYEGLPDLIDRFVETWQGLNSKIIKHEETIKIKNDCGCAQMLKEKHKEIQSYYQGIEHGSLKQILDDICELIASTIYKLENLK